MILIVDNHDSFTYNLVQAFATADARMMIVKNDEIDVDACLALTPEALVISPGPGRPERAGITPAAIRAFAGLTPILGVCLGHQAIGHAFGAHIARASQLMHGRTSQIFHENHGVFEGLPCPFVAARYHSLVVDREGFPDVLEVTAWTEDGEIMGLRHRTLEVEGVQFHPESFLTSHGHVLLSRFLERLPQRGAVPARDPAMEWGGTRR